MKAALPASLESAMPPVARRLRWLPWMRANLFRTPLDAMITVAVAGIFIWVVAQLVPWAFINATWTGSSQADCAPDGACWAFVVNRAGQFIYGFYPVGERWRVDLAGLGLVVGLAALMAPRVPGKAYSAAFMLLVYPVIAFWLLKGGFLGLPEVGTERWGGLLLTLVLGVSGLVLSFPFGVLLALGRRSSLPLISGFSVLFIELCRGVPLITMLFMASIMLPFFLPVGVRLDNLALAVTGIVLFQSAYLAEVVRGGLQAIPRGQYEACQALGFGYWRTTGYVILPQAIRKVIPGLVNNSIALLKDTTLVLVVGLFELLNIVNAGASDPAWLGSTTEGYVVVGIVFWTLCFSMSRYSQHLERKMQTERRQ